MTTTKRLPIGSTVNINGATATVIGVGKYADNILWKHGCLVYSGGPITFKHLLEFKCGCKILSGNNLDIIN